MKSRKAGQLTAFMATRLAWKLFNFSEVSDGSVSYLDEREINGRNVQQQNGVNSLLRYFQLSYQCCGMISLLLCVSWRFRSGFSTAN